MPWVKQRLNRRPDPAAWNFLGDPPAGFTFLADEKGQILIIPVITVNPADSDPVSGGSALRNAAGASNRWAAARVLGDALAGDETGAVAIYDWNEINYDRRRNNTPTTVFASAARTATANSADITNFNARGARFILDITAASGTAPTLDVKIQSKGVLSATYTDIPSAAFAQKTATGTDDLVVYPGVVASANRSLSQIISRTYRAVATIAGTTPSFTFSLEANYVL